MGTYTDFKFLRQISNTLRNYKEDATRINFSCPFCGDSKKNKWKARGYIFIHKDTCLYKCHNCGESKCFSNFLKSLDEGAWREWLLESRNEQPTFRLLPPPQRVSLKKSSYEGMVPISTLSEYHPCIKYVQSRRIPQSRLNLLWYTQDYRELVHEVFPCDNEEKKDRYPKDARLVIPFWSQNKELIGLTGRSLGDSKIRYSTATSDDHPPYFGMERVDLSKPVFVVEGQLDSLFLPNSIAIGSSNLGMFCKTFPDVKSYTLVFDNEPRNVDIVKIMKKAVSEGANVCIWHGSGFKGKDINEMYLNGASLKSIVEFIMTHSFSGKTAEFKMYEWTKSKL